MLFTIEAGNFHTDKTPLSPPIMINLPSFEKLIAFVKLQFSSLDNSEARLAVPISYN